VGNRAACAPLFSLTKLGLHELRGLSPLDFHELSQDKPSLVGQTNGKSQSRNSISARLWKPLDMHACTICSTCIACTTQASKRFRGVAVKDEAGRYINAVWCGTMICSQYQLLHFPTTFKRRVHTRSFSQQCHTFGTPMMSCNSAMMDDVSATLRPRAANA
jgi:hypothetical protein